MRLWTPGIAALWLTLAACAARADLPAAVGQALDAVIEIYSADGQTRFLGSGLVWTDGRTGVTNAHVTGPATRVEARFRDGSRVVVPVVARDRRRDLALLALPAARPGLEPAATLPPPGTEVIALGAPMGLGFSATSGIVAAAPRQVDANVPLRLLQHDAALNPGSSGGPLIDTSGRLLGMNAQIANGSRLFFGISYAIAAPDLARLVPALAAGDLAPVPELGLDLRPVGVAEAAALAVAEIGLLIDDVLPAGAARDAGLRPGDILLAANGQVLARPGDLAFALDSGGTTARLRVRRDGAEIEIDIALTTPPPVPQPPDAPGDRAPLTFSDLSVRLDPDGRVAAVDPGSTLARQGLTPGDRILRLNGQPAAPGSLEAAVLTAPFLMLIERDGRHLHLSADPWTPLRGPAIAGGNSLDLAVVRF